MKRNEKKTYKKPEVKSIKLPTKTTKTISTKKSESGDRVALVVHIPVELKKALKTLAGNNDLSLSAFSRGVLAGRYKAPTA